MRNISWGDAQQFVGWLRQLTGKPYRLLSEAEWEYAARGRHRHRLLVGRQGRLGPGRLRKNCGGAWDRKQPSAIGRFDPNPFGLHDMNGGVAEWTADCWFDDYQGAAGEGAGAGPEELSAAGSARRLLEAGGRAPPLDGAALLRRAGALQRKWPARRADPELAQEHRSLPSSAPLSQKRGRSAVLAERPFCRCVVSVRMIRRRGYFTVMVIRLDTSGGLCRDVVVVAHDQLQRVAPRRQLEHDLALSGAEVQVVLVVGDLFVGRRRRRVDDQVVMAGVGLLDARRRNAEVAQPEPDPEGLLGDDLAVAGPADVEVGVVGPRRLAGGQGQRRRGRSGPRRRPGISSARSSLLAVGRRDKGLGPFGGLRREVRKAETSGGTITVIRSE